MSTDRLALADQCQSVTLTPRYASLVDVAADMHCIGNDGSGERWKTDQSYRERARMGYTAELAVAQHYDLVPRIDYRPPTVGDDGHDYRVRFDGETATVDVKATRTDPPKLYLTKKRAWHDRYALPDYYLLVAPHLTDGDRIHLVGWTTCERVREEGEDAETYGNPVWRLDGRELDPPPSPDALEDLPRFERRLWQAADARGLGATTVHTWAAIAEGE